MRLYAAVRQCLVQPEFVKRALNRRVHSREDNLYASLLVALYQVLQVVYACRVYERHFPHSYDSNLGAFAASLLELLETIGQSEKERSADFVYCHSLRDVKHRSVVRREAFLVLAGSDLVGFASAYVRCFHYASYE